MPFEPGTSGNAGGRPSKRITTDALMMEMKAREKDGDKRGMRKVAIKVWDLAEDGERWAVEFIRDTLDGKPVQAVQTDMHLEAGDSLTNLLTKVADRGLRLVPNDSDDQS